MPWALRAVWAVQPVTAGPALDAALSGRSTPVQLIAACGLWLGWAAVLLASLVRSPLGLTVLRLGAAANVLVACVAASSGDVSVAESLGALVGAVVAAALAFAPAIGISFVNGGAYPNERRFPLRPPGPVLAGPLPLASVALLASPATGALLLAAKQWLVGALVLAVSGPAAAFASRAIHGLARRWLVFVPAGVVIVDPFTLADPVLFERPRIDSLGPAPRKSEGIDLTMDAFGLALELRLKTDAQIVRSKPGRRGRHEVMTVSTTAVRFSPTRPGAVLTEAAKRRVPLPD
jgi:hypothetical protein